MNSIQGLNPFKPDLSCFFARQAGYNVINANALCQRLTLDPEVHLPFENRKQAGIALAARLRSLEGAAALVLAIPRGGVIVGYEVAKALGAPWMSSCPARSSASSGRACHRRGCGLG